MPDLNQHIKVTVSAEFNDFSQKFAQASRDIGHFQTLSKKGASSTQIFEAAATRVSGAVATMGAAIGVAAVARFADFDQEMAKVRVNTGATGSELDRLRDAALNAGQSTIYNAHESADAINELAKAGMSTKDILGGGLTGALNLAAAGSMSVSEAAEDMASAMNEFNLKGNQANHVADLLAAGANLAQGDVSDFANALTMVGVNAHQTGMSLEETTGVLTLLASKGLVGSRAGVELRSALIGLQSPSNVAKKAMDDLGISLYDQQGKFVGMAKFAGELHSALSKLPADQRSYYMGQIFSNAAMTVGNTLYDAGAKGVENYTKKIQQNGFAQRQGQALMSTLKGSFEQFSGAAETALIRIGSQESGVVKNVVDGATNMLTAFGQLPPAIQTFVFSLGTLSATAGALHPIMKKGANSTNSFIRTISQTIDPVRNATRAFEDWRGAIHTSVNSLQKSYGSVESASHQFGEGMRDGVVKSLGEATKAFGQYVSASRQLRSTVSDAQAGKASIGELEAAENRAGSAADAFTGHMRSAGQGIKAGLKAGVSSVIDLLGGPWGIALAAGTVAINARATSVANGKTQVDNLKQSIQGGLSETESLTKAINNNELGFGTGVSWLDNIANGATNVKDALEKAGISQQTYIGYIEGDSKATAEFKARQHELATSLDITKQGAASAAGALYDAAPKIRQQWKDATKAAKEASKEEEEQKRSSVANTLALGQNTQAAADNAVAKNKDASAAKQVASAEDILAEVFGASKNAVNDQAEAWSNVYSAAKTYNDFANEVISGQYSVAHSFRQVQDSIKQNGATLDANTEKGYNNYQALSQYAKAAQDDVTALGKAGQLDQANQKLDEYRSQFVQLATQVGLSSDQANQWADSMIGSSEQLEQMSVKAGIAGRNIADAANDLQKHPLTLRLQGGKDVQDQIGKINGLKLDPKTGKVTFSGTDDAKYTLLALNKMKLIDKNGNIKLNGEQDVQRVVNEANKLKIEDKGANVTITGDKNALNQLAKIKGAKLDPKTSTVTLKGTAEAKKALDAIAGVKMPDKSGNVTLNPDQANQVLTALGKKKGPTVKGKATLDPTPVNNTIAQLNSKQLAPHTAKLDANPNPAYGKMNKVDNRKLKPHRAKLDANPNPANNQMDKVDARKLNPKSIAIKADPAIYNQQIKTIMDQNLEKTITVNAKEAHALGGYISGPGSGTSDSIPAMLSNGEYVMNASAVSRLGRNFFDQINYANRVPVLSLPPNNTVMLGSTNGSRVVEIDPSQMNELRELINAGKFVVSDQVQMLREELPDVISDNAHPWKSERDFGRDVRRQASMGR